MQMLLSCFQFYYARYNYRGQYPENIEKSTDWLGRDGLRASPQPWLPASTHITAFDELLFAVLRMRCR